MKDDISWLVGKDTRVIVACRKGSSIGRSTTANRKICLPDIDHRATAEQPIPTEQSIISSHSCNKKRCLTCAMMFNSDEQISINYRNVLLADSTNCKSKNVLYMLQCTKCPKDTDNTYIGQTRQECHSRMNGHRASFDNDPNVFDGSAVATHAYTKHDPPLELTDFKCGVLKTLPSPLNLDREEFKLIERFRTNTRGINRCRVSN